MRFSCNGCRVLRKGCSEDCCIRPCLQWIKSPKAQANATLFLAKFYGRAGLLNLINAGPEHLRPSIFKSLLQEACGRIVNPIYGSSGLISTGGWHLCEAAVEAVLSGLPITQISIETAVENANPLFKACDIRHIPKKSTEVIHKVNNRTLFKRSKSKPKKVEPVALMGELSGVDSVGYDGSRVSQSGGSDSGSVETVEDTLAKPNKENEFGLDLTLGFEKAQALGTVEEENDGSESCDESSWKCELTLGLPELC